MKERVTWALLGRKLEHSFSPLIHKELGCPDYKLVELEQRELEGYLKSQTLGGINVTIPYKKDIIAYLDELTPDAKAIGAVNTIAQKDGKLIGHNTDASGFLYTAKRINIDFAGKKVLVLGSGGASLAVKYALEKAGAKTVITVSRSGHDNYENFDRHFDAEIIVNTTPVGMYPDLYGKILDLSPFAMCKGVIDLIYNPFRTNLLIQAEELGIPFANGLSMLVAQARDAEEFFLDKIINDSEVERIIAHIASKKRNIALVGMPGVGKTTVGKELSRISGKEFIDTDALIEEKAKMTIPEIFKSQGEEVFRRLEADAVRDAVRNPGAIIALGGGAVKTESNYYELKRTSLVYHLERNVSCLARDGRPLSSGNLEKMYEERLPLYKKFRDRNFDQSDTPEKCAQKIWRDFCENCSY